MWACNLLIEMKLNEIAENGMLDTYESLSKDILKSSNFFTFPPY